MEDASSLRYGCLVHYYCLWCISIHRGYTCNFTEEKWFLWDCLREGRVPKLAGLPALMLHYKITENVVKTKLRNKFFLYF